MNARVTITDAELAQARSERGWTETRTKVALALFNSGMSATLVASEIGGISRNGVIGKVHRLGAVDRDRPLPSCSNGNSTGVPKERRRRSSGSRFLTIAPPRVREAPPPPVVDLEIAPEQRRSLVELDETVCHWPVGDPCQPGFFFCGAPAKAGKPYCRAHHFAATDPSGSRRAVNLRTKLSAARPNNWWG